jgi:hypothetical protein
LLPDAIASFCAPGPKSVDKKLSPRIASKFMSQLVKAPNRVSESLGNLRCGKLLDEVSPQRFILPVGSVLRREKDLGKIHLTLVDLKVCLHGHRFFVPWPAGVDESRKSAYFPRNTHIFASRPQRRYWPKFLWRRGVYFLRQKVAYTTFSKPARILPSSSKIL